VFWRNILRLRGKKSNIARSIKDENGVLVRNEGAAWQMERGFNDLLNPVTVMPPNTQEPR